MARWSNLDEQSNLHAVEIVQSFKNSSVFCPNFDSPSNYSGFESFDFNDCENRLRRLFNEVLTSLNKHVHPIPALLNDGRPVDLFKLFLVVTKRGGFDSVSKNGLWSFVADDCGGLGFVSGSNIKLIYNKYLSELDRWLRQIFMKKGSNYRDNRGLQNLDLLLLDLETEFKTMLSEKSKKINDDDEKSISDKKMFKDVSLLGKRKKRESFSFHGMLHWLINLAKSCGDPKIVGITPEFSKWKEYGNEELWVQAMLAREALLIKRHIDPKIEESLLQKKQRMHPSMYEDTTDILNLPSPEKVRCSKRLPTSTKTQFCPCCHSNSPSAAAATTPTKIPPPPMKIKAGPATIPTKILPPLAKIKAGPATPTKISLPPVKIKTGPAPPTKISLTPVKVKAGPVTPIKIPPPLANVEAGPALTPVEISPVKILIRHVSVGPEFQALVPEWTGKMTSDPKWLGTRMWPVENKNRNKNTNSNSKAFLEFNPIGKGRHNSCGCGFPGSISCVRFHIAEKRMKLKVEIGDLFFRWRFHRMGEEMSLSWTMAEERRFKDMVRQNSRSQNKFWSNFSRFFPFKTKENLVSFYFNAYLVQRRSYQNRVTPKNIDSDDDESEFGSVGEGFGLETIRVPGSKLMNCSENMECTDLELA